MTTYLDFFFVGMTKITISKWLLVLLTQEKWRLLYSDSYIGCWVAIFLRRGRTEGRGAVGGDLATGVALNLALNLSSLSSCGALCGYTYYILINSLPML